MTLFKRYPKTCLLLVILLTSWIAIPYFIPTDFIARIAKEQMAKHTPMTLEVEHIALKAFPRLAIVVDKAVLRQASNQSLLASIDYATLSLEVIPLLSKKLYVHHVALEGVRADVDKVRTLLAASSPPPAANSTATSSATTSDSSAIALKACKSLTIADAKWTMDGKKWDIAELELAIPIDLQGTWKLATAFTIDAVPYAATVEARASQSGKSWKIAALDSSIELEGRDIWHIKGKGHTTLQEPFVVEADIDVTHRYSGKARETQEPSSRSSATHSSDSVPAAPPSLPSWLASLDATIALRSSHLALLPLPLEKATILLTAKKGVISLEKAEMLFKQGNIYAKGHSTLVKQSMDHVYTLDVKDMDLAMFLPAESPLSLRHVWANAALVLSGQGLTDHALKRTLEGKGSFALTPGKISNVRDTLPGALGFLFPALPETITYDRCGGTFTANHGVIHLAHTQCQANIMDIEGGGTIQLPANKYDLTWNMQLHDDYVPLLKTGGKNFVVYVRGPLHSPSVSVDMINVIGNMIKDHINDPNALLQQGLEGFGKQLQNILR